MSTWYRKPLMALAAGSLLLFVPLLNSFHIDSAILAGFFGTFAGAWSASRIQSKDQDVLLLISLFYTAAIPLFVRDLVSGCFSVDGAAFWMFIPLFSILFGFSLGRLMRFLIPDHARVLSLLAVFFIFSAGLLATFMLVPQIFFFNHVFGFWPGAIYDENVTFSGRVVLYRTITLSWTGIFWMIPHLGNSGRTVKAIFLMLCASLAINYATATRNGLISTRNHIKTELGGLHKTEHFKLYYSKGHYSLEEVYFLGHLHEFHFSELIDTLKVDWPEEKRIESFLYGHEWQMQRLTGAKRVSYVPVWQKTPQMHIRKTAIEGTLRHELVHIIARSFGNRFLNASWNAGLVEGLAVALSPASSTRLTADQLVVSNEAFYSNKEISRLFSFTGFYRESGSVAYGVSGSYVASLLREYPVERFKTAYRQSSLEAGYGDVLQESIKNWHTHVMQQEVTVDERELAQQVFAIPSIFEAGCPRIIPVTERYRDRFRHAMAERDTLQAIGYLENLIMLNPDDERAWFSLIRIMLERNRPDEILNRSEQLPEHPAIAVVKADAMVMAGRAEEAMKIRSEAMKSENLSETVLQAWRIRNHPDQWTRLMHLISRPDLSPADPPDLLMKSEDPVLHLIYFQEWFRRNPVLSVFTGTPRTDTSAQDNRTLDTLLSVAFQMPPDPSWFETYKKLIYLAAFTEIPAEIPEPFVRDTNRRPLQQIKMEEAYRFFRFVRVRQSEITLLCCI